VDFSSLTDEAHAQLMLPLRLGGLGLRSMVDTAPAAFLGSLAAAAPYLPSPHLLVSSSHLRPGARPISSSSSSRPQASTSRHLPLPCHSATSPCPATHYLPRPVESPPQLPTSALAISSTSSP
jgi:hypothetical protein